MDVIQFFIPPDRVHVGVEPFMDREMVFAEGIPLPLGQRLDDFAPEGLIVFDIETDRAFNPVEIVVKSARRIHEERGAHAAEVQLFRKMLLKGVLDEFDRHLGFVKPQDRLIIDRYDKFFHTPTPPYVFDIIGDSLLKGTKDFRPSLKSVD
jgi:hypothetical protein